MSQALQYQQYPLPNLAGGAALAPGAGERQGYVRFFHFVALFCLTLCFMSLWPSDALETGLNISRFIELSLLCTGTGIIGAIAGSKQSWRVRMDRTALWIIALFCTWAFLSGIWSPARLLSVGKAIELAFIAFSAAMVGCWAAVYLPSPKTLPSIMALAMTSVILLLIAYNVPMHGTPLAVPPGVGRQRLILGFSHPLEGADLIALALITLLASGLGKPLKLVLFLVVGALFALTQPRGAAGGFVAGIGAMLFVRIRRPDVRGIVFVLVMMIVAAVLMFIGPDLPKVMDILIPDDADSLNGRTEVWEYAFECIVNKPVLGYGFYASRFLLLDLFSWAGHTHNAYLEVAISLGIPGLLLMLAFMVHVVRVTLHTKDVWLAGVAGYCFSVSILDPLLMTPTIPMVVMLLAVMHAGSRDPLQQQQQKPRLYTPHWGNEEGNYSPDMARG